MQCVDRMDGKEGRESFFRRRDWEDQEITQINRETSHAPWGAFENK